MPDDIEGEMPAGLGPDEPDAQTTTGGFDPDPDRVDLLRDTAEDIRGDSSESQQLAAILYRVSDLYDPSEETTPEEIYLNVRNIMNVKASGGLDR